jgi:hypothetical protein
MAQPMRSFPWLLLLERSASPTSVPLDVQNVALSASISGRVTNRAERLHQKRLLPCGMEY